MKIPRIRFSIGSLLLALAVFALLPAYYVAMHKAYTLAKKNEQLKHDSGFIEAIDPDRFYLRELRCPFEACWQFRHVTPSDRIWIKVGTFTDEIPTRQNVTETGKEQLVLKRHGTFQLRLVDSSDGGVTLRAIYSASDGGSGRLPVPMPFYIDLAKQISGWKHMKKASRMHRDSLTTHGEARSYAVDEFIPLFVLEGDGPDEGKKAVVYLELRKPYGHIEEFRQRNLHGQ